MVPKSFLLLIQIHTVLPALACIELAKCIAFQLGRLFLDKKETEGKILYCYVVVLADLQKVLLSVLIRSNAPLQPLKKELQTFKSQEAEKPVD